MKKLSIFFSLITLLLITLYGCGQNSQPSTGPIFTDPATKIAELSTQDFTIKIFYEAVALEP
ncbi:MAG: hypothetical protein WC632_05095 [Candidatus Margulisiibacteriota bacterium]